MMSVSDGILAIFCAAMYVLTKNELYQNTYIYFSYFYVLIGSIIILVNSYKIGKQMKTSMITLNKENNNDNETNEGNTNIADGGSPIIVAPDIQIKTKYDKVETEQLSEETMKMVESALQEIIITIISIIMVILCIIIACIWRLIFGGDAFMIHYIFVSVLCGLSIINQFKLRKRERINKIINGKNEKATIKIIKPSIKSTEASIKSIATTTLPHTPQPVVTDIPSIINEEQIFDTNNIETATEPTKIIYSSNASMHGPDSVVSVLPFGSKDDDIKKLQLPDDTINIDLESLTYSGRPIGKRGKTKLSKREKEIELQQIKEMQSTPVSTLKDEVACNHNIGELPLFEDITKMNFNNISATTDSIKRVLDDVLNTISLSDDGYFDDDEAIKIIVFEFGNVICTQIDKLHNKLDTFIDSKQLIQKQMFFGGIDRINKLREFLNGLNNDIRFFLISQEQSTMIVKLLKEIDLLKPFVSKNKNKKNKLISNIIGDDNIYSKQCGAKTHLILLKLLKNLSISHDQMLFVSNNKESIQHLKSIKICKTYLVETKGLTFSDLDTIQSLYFCNC